jgi:phosphopantothenoylcysteine decarboxylase/phosphopantothenate--cysteine ligase
MFVVVGVTGGIAAYKTVHLVRALVTNGHEVHVVPTEDSLRFVGTTTWEAVSRNPVTTSVHDDVARVRHVASAPPRPRRHRPGDGQHLAKMAAGIADDLLGVTLLATTAPVVVAPAMHTAMWEHAATQANIARCGARRARGGPGRRPADGRRQRRGPGRMWSRGDRRGAGDRRAARRSRGLRVAVSTGGTREPIDPVRFSATAPSGRQGAELARRRRRARDVVLVAATDDGVLASVPPRTSRWCVGTAAELQDGDDGCRGRRRHRRDGRRGRRLPGREVSREKLRKEDGVPRLDLVTTPTSRGCRRTPARPDRHRLRRRDGGHDDASCSRGAPQAERKGATCWRSTGSMGPRLRGDRQPRAAAGCRRHPSCRMPRAPSASPTRSGTRSPRPADGGVTAFRLVAALLANDREASPVVEREAANASAASGLLLHVQQRRSVRDGAEGDGSTVSNVSPLRTITGVISG